MRGARDARCRDRRDPVGRPCARCRRPLAAAPRLHRHAARWDEHLAGAWSRAHRLLVAVDLPGHGALGRARRPGRDAVERDGRRPGRAPRRARRRAGGRPRLLARGARRAPARRRPPGGRPPPRAREPVRRASPTDGRARRPPRRRRGARRPPRARRHRRLRRRAGSAAGVRQPAAPAPGRARDRAARDAASATTRPGSPPACAARGRAPWSRCTTASPAIAAPTLVIAGALDPVGRPARGRVAAGIPGARLAVVDGAGHTPHVERPDAFRRLVTRLPARSPTHDRHAPAAPSVTWTPVREYKDIRYEHSGTGIAKVTIDRPRGPQRVPAPDRARADRRVRPDPRRRLDRLRAADRRGRQGVLLGRRPVVQGPRRRLRRRRRRRPPQRPRPPAPDPHRCRSRSSRSSTATRSAAATCSTSCATCRSPSDNAIFGQVGPRVGSFDAGFGIGLLARLVGDKKAKEIWFLCRQYSAAEALEMGLVNKVVPLAEPRGRGRASGRTRSST